MSNNLTSTSSKAIDIIVYQILRLAKLDSPLIDHPSAFGFPYEELIDFAYSLDDATDEEKEFVKLIIATELNEGSYLSEPYQFIENLLYFFSDNLDIDLNSFWFGKTVLDEIINIVGTEISEKYADLFVKLGHGYYD